MNKTLSIITFIICISILNGSTINNIYTYNHSINNDSAYKIAINPSFSLNSTDNQYLAIGADNNDVNGPNSGRVFIKKRNSITGQISAHGEIADAYQTDAYFGHALEFNSDGSQIIIGAPDYDVYGATNAGRVSVYSNNGQNTQWSRMGNFITGSENNEYLGKSVSIASSSNPDTIIATGSPDYGNYRGRVKVYQYFPSNYSWVQKGQVLVGEQDLDRFGASCSLSSDGQVLAVTAEGYWGGPGVAAGKYIKIYRWDGPNFLWVHEHTITESDSPNFVLMGDLSEDGNYLAYGCAESNNPDLFDGLYAGHVRVFEYTNSGWNQLGNIVRGSSYNERMVTGKISNNGSILLTRSVDVNNSGRGIVRAYALSGNNWVKIGSNLTGSNYDYFGASISLSSDGSVFAVGSRQWYSSSWINNGNYIETNNGRGRVNLYSMVQEIEISIDSQGAPGDVKPFFLGEEGVYDYGENFDDLSGDGIWGEYEYSNFYEEYDEYGEILSFYENFLYPEPFYDSEEIELPVTYGDGVKYIRNSSNSSVGGPNIINWGDNFFLKAIPEEGSSFAGWYEGGSLISEEIDLNLTYNRSRSLTARFVQKPVFSISEELEIANGSSFEVVPIITEGYPNNYTYQWYFGVFPIPAMFGGTAFSYTIDGDTSLQGDWRLQITNDAGTTSKNFSILVRPDSDGDGIFDYNETNTGIWVSEEDTGTDPNNPDTDSDTYNDKDDLFPLDPNEWLDTDSDGVGDNADAFPNNPTETIDTDGDGLGNNADTDDDGDSLTDAKELEFGTDPLIQDNFNSLIQLINSEDFSPRIDQSLYDSIVTQKDNAISRKNTLQASLDVYDNYTIPRIDINEVLTTWLGYTYDPIDDVRKVDPSVDVDQNKLQYLDHFRGILDNGPLSEEIKEDVILGLRVAINHKISREYWKARAKSLPSQAEYDSAIAEKDQARTERDARPTQASYDGAVAARDAASNGLTSDHIPNSLSGLIEVYSTQAIDTNGLPITDEFGTSAVYYPNETVLQYSDGTSIFSVTYSWDKDTQTLTEVNDTGSFTYIYEFLETSNTSIYMFNSELYFHDPNDETQTQFMGEGFGFMYDADGDLNKNTVSDRIDFIGQSYSIDGNFDNYLTDKTTIISNQVPDSLPKLRTLNMYSLDEIQNLSLGSATMEIINGANTLLSSEIKEKYAQGNWTNIVPVSEEIPIEQNEDKKFYRFKIKDSIYETSSN